ncbi:MAG: SycD/LcrH family type III secretion system chaperone [Anaerolineae bacterium]
MCSKQAVLQTKEECEIVYATAFGLYESSNYKEASMLFTQLVFSDPFEKKYWYALASSRQMEQDYVAALHAWSLAALLSERDPLPHFHAAECMLSIGDFNEALKALDAAQGRIKDKEKDRTLNGKIELLKQLYSSKSPMES